MMLTLLMLPLFSVKAFAAKGTLNDPVTVSNTSYSEATAILREALMNRESECKIYAKKNGTVSLSTVMRGIKEDAFKHTGKAAEGDYLLYNLDGITYGYHTGSYDPSIGAAIPYFEYSMTYHDSASEERTMASKVSSVLSGLSLSGKTQYQKVKAIYDYMTANIRYDNSYTKYSGYDALCRNCSVCQGYASSFYRLCLSTNIQCRVVTGISTNTKGGKEEHAWNIVKIGSYWYNVDVTWDAVYRQANQDYKYFLKSNSDFAGHSRDYEFSDSEFNSSYPMTSKSYDAGSTKKYRLTINGGSGSGTYSSGTIVTIKASNATAGKNFIKWIGTATYNGGTTSRSATARIRVNKNTTLTASYDYADAGVKAGNYKVASVNSPAKKTIQIKGNSKKNNARVVVGKKSAKTATFQIKSAGGGYYYLVNKKTKKYLNLKGNNAVQGSRGSTSRWRIVKSSPSVYRMINTNGKAATLSGKNLVAQPDTNRAVQQFKIGK